MNHLAYGDEAALYYLGNKYSKIFDKFDILTRLILVVASPFLNEILRFPGYAYIEVLKVRVRLSGAQPPRRQNVPFNIAQT